MCGVRHCHEAVPIQWQVCQVLRVGTVQKSHSYCQGGREAQRLRDLRLSVCPQVTRSQDLLGGVRTEKQEHCPRVQARATMQALRKGLHPQDAKAQDLLLSGVFLRPQVCPQGGKAGRAG